MMKDRLIAQHEETILWQAKRIAELLDAPQQPAPATQLREQEPVAWINPDEQNARKAFHWVESEEFTSAVYATPPKEKNT